MILTTSTQNHFPPEEFFPLFRERLGRLRAMEDSKKASSTFPLGPTKSLNLHRSLMDTIVRMADTMETVHGVEIRKASCFSLMRESALPRYMPCITQDIRHLRNTFQLLIEMNMERKLASGIEPSEVVSDISKFVSDYLRHTIKALGLTESMAANEQQGLASTGIAIFLWTSLLAGSPVFMSNVLQRHGYQAKKQELVGFLQLLANSAGTSKDEICDPENLLYSLTLDIVYLKKHWLLADEEAENAQEEEWKKELNALYPKKLPFRGYAEAFLQMKRLQHGFSLENELAPYLATYFEALCASDSMPDIAFEVQSREPILVSLEHKFHTQPKENQHETTELLRTASFRLEKPHRRSKPGAHRSNMRDDPKLKTIFGLWDDRYLPPLEADMHLVFDPLTHSLSLSGTKYTILKELGYLSASSVSLYSMLADHPAAMRALHAILTEALPVLTEGYLDSVTLVDRVLPGQTKAPPAITVASEETPEQEGEEIWESLEEVPQDLGTGDSQESTPSFTDAFMHPVETPKDHVIATERCLYDLREEELYILSPLRGGAQPTEDSRQRYLAMTGRPLPEGMALHRLHWKGKRPAVSWPTVIHILCTYFDVQLYRNQSASHIRYIRNVGEKRFLGNLMHKRETAMIGTLQKALRTLGIPEALFWIAHSHMRVASGKGLSVQDLLEISDLYALKVGTAVH